MNEISITFGSTITSYELPNLIRSERSYNSTLRGWKTTYVASEFPDWFNGVEVIEDYYEPVHKLRLLFVENKGLKARSGRIVLRQDISGEELVINVTQGSVQRILTFGTDPEAAIYNKDVSLPPKSPESVEFQLYSEVFDAPSGYSEYAPISIVHYSGSLGIVGSMSVGRVSGMIAYVKLTFVENTSDEERTQVLRISNGGDTYCYINITQKAFDTTFLLDYNGGQYKSLEIKYHNIGDSQTIKVLSSILGSSADWTYQIEDNDTNANIVVNEGEPEPPVIPMFDIAIRTSDGTISTRLIAMPITDTTCTVTLKQTGSNNICTLLLIATNSNVIFEDQEFPGKETVELKIGSNVGDSLTRKITSTSDGAYVNWQLGAGLKSGYWSEEIEENPPWPNNPDADPPQPQPFSWPTWSEDSLEVTKEDNNTLKIKTKVAAINIDNKFEVVVTQETSEKLIIYKLTQEASGDKLEVGDFITKDLDVIKFEDLKDSDLDNLLGIYIGNNQDTMELMFIPATDDFDITETYTFCSESQVAFDLTINITEAEVLAKRYYDGFDQTELLVKLAENNNRDSKYFPGVDFCVTYNPNKDKGDWYLPALGELNTISSNKDLIMSSIVRIYDTVTIEDLKEMTLMSCTGYSKRDSIWGIKFDGTAVSNLAVNTKVNVLPVFKLKEL